MKAEIGKCFKAFTLLGTSIAKDFAQLKAF